MANEYVIVFCELQMHFVYEALPPEIRDLNLDERVTKEITADVDTGKDITLDEFVPKEIDTVQVFGIETVDVKVTTELTYEDEQEIKKMFTLDEGVTKEITVEGDTQKEITLDQEVHKEIARDVVTGKDMTFDQTFTKEIDAEDAPENE